MANLEGLNLMIWIIISVIPSAIAMHKAVPALFLFGDSLLDAGTNNYVPNSSIVANFPPYGETYFHRSTGRFTNGRTVGDFLALALNLPLAKPYLEPGADHNQGANFASAGSGLLDSTSSDQGVIPFKQQIKQFQQLAAQFEAKFGRSTAQKLISNSLFLISTGSNDLGSNYLANSTLQQSISVSDFITSLMQAYEESILALYKARARKIVLFELTAFGCSPSARLEASLLNHTGCLMEANQLALTFNVALGNMIRNLSATLQHVQILQAKTFNPLIEIINNGEHYGFVSTIDACCGVGPFNALITCGDAKSNTSYKVCQFPSKYLFWDGDHLTEAAYCISFKKYWSGNTSYIEPFNIRTLINSSTLYNKVLRTEGCHPVSCG